MVAKVLLLLALVGVALAAPAANKIASLPGIGKLNFSQYSGYINVDAKSNRNLFYWFVESQSNPAKDPLLLWMNGGPGASSLLGFWTEHGPFRPNSDGKTLTLNPYSWNQIANIIYLEAPAGVGFSYSDNKTDYTTNDTIFETLLGSDQTSSVLIRYQTAQDNFAFLQGWFAEYPEFRVNDFYVTGESYGGHYCPELANLILTANAPKNSSSYINMKGLLVGNPGTENDWYYNVDEYAFVTYMYTHGLIPELAYEKSVQACQWNFFLTNCSNTPFVNPTPACLAATTAAVAYIPQNIDSTSSNDFVDMRRYTSRWNRIARKYFPHTATASAGHSRSRYYSPPNFPFDPCVANYMVSYMNMPAVQTAIHARSGNWEPFGNITYEDEMEFMNPLWAKFINTTNWRILIYSGDADSAVPFVGTQRWIQCLNSPVTKAWANWNYEGNVGGSVIQYKGISFLTIKGAGHMVPWYAPDLAYRFYSRWLLQQPY